MNRSIATSLFEVMHGCKSRKPIDLIHITHHPKISKSASAFASHVHDLYNKISKKIQENNVHLKSHVDLHHKQLEFNEGNYVIIRI